MSALSVADLTFGDVLDENKSKPWWEKFRGYFFASGVFSSLSMLYVTITNGISVSCLPDGQNKSEMGNFSAVQAAAVNAYCAHRVPWIVTYVGATGFVVSLIVLVISSRWLSHPAVVNSFSTLAKVNEIISSLNMTSLELRDAVVKPIGQDASEAYKKLRKAAMLIWDYKSSSNIQEIYLRRCFGLILTLFFTVVGSIVLTIFLFKTPSEFDCKVDENDRFAFLPELSSYECTSGKNWNLFWLFSLSFCVSQFGQLGFVCIGCWKIARMKPPESESEQAKRNARFVISFWKSGNPSDSGLLKEFFDYVFSPEAAYRMSKHLKTATLEGDLNFLNQHYKLEGFNHMTTILLDIVEKPPADYEKVEKSILYIIASLPRKVDSYRQLLESLAKKKRWRLLTAALDRCIFPEISPSETNYRLQWLKEYVNLDEIATVHHRAPLDEEAGSLLYYAISPEFHSRGYQYKAAKCLLRTMNDGRVKYVHFRGNSTTLKWFVFIHCAEQREEVLRYADVPEPVTNGQGTRNEPQIESASQAEIALLYAELKDVGNNPPEGYLDGLTNRVYRYKFSSWNGSPTEFAKYSIRHSLWKVFVTLLNAYIVTEEERREQNIGKLSCGVESFEPKHIESIFPICLKAQPHGYFVPTAARHILACCTSFQRKLCLKHIHDPKYNLSEEDKECLLRFIETCQGSAGVALGAASLPDMGFTIDGKLIPLPSGGDEAIPLISGGDEEILITSERAEYSRKDKKDRQSRI